MTDIVSTTGRRMSLALQRAIDDEPDRDLVARALREYAVTSPAMGRLFTALATELELAQIREAHALRLMAADLAAPDDRPYPQASGPAWFPDDVA